MHIDHSLSYVMHEMQKGSKIYNKKLLYFPPYKYTEYKRWKVTISSGCFLIVSTIYGLLMKWNYRTNICFKFNFRSLLIYVRICCIVELKQYIIFLILNGHFWQFCGYWDPKKQMIWQFPFRKQKDVPKVTKKDFLYFFLLDIKCFSENEFVTIYVRFYSEIGQKICYILISINDI